MMKSPLYSAAMTSEVDRLARVHLLRRDRQEDVCFALWYPSAGSRRNTALIHKLILPEPGDRLVHGNASFQPQYFERALAEATKAGAGLALLHSHPFGSGWQDMSPDDVAAEMGHAGATFGATGRPLVGLTLAGDSAWSARFWIRSAPRTYVRQWCGSVRVVGERLSVTYMDALIPPPRSTEEQIRTVSAWGEAAQADMTRLRIGIVGAGSVGGVVAESLARSGFTDVVLIDFDEIKRHNLDRLIYAKRSDVGQLKVDVLRDRMLACGTAEEMSVRAVPLAVYEDEGFRAALDCDILFSCVDRPWGRHVLNFVAYAHLIPIVDGGIAVRTNRSGMLVAADWRAHTVAPGRPCLQCLGQYSSGFVQTEREGMLDDATYIDGLPKDHVLKASENVFAFSTACASLQVLQMIAMVVAPLGHANPGAQLYHFVGGFMEPPRFTGCHDECSFPALLGRGDASGISVTGRRVAQSSIAREDAHLSELPSPRRSGVLSTIKQLLRDITKTWFGHR